MHFSTDENKSLSNTEGNTESLKILKLFHDCHINVRTDIVFDNQLMLTVDSSCIFRDYNFFLLTSPPFWLRLILIFPQWMNPNDRDECLTAIELTSAVCVDGLLQNLVQTFLVP